MEVHHHPEVEKKRLKDYLLEGLMIFVAVTLGFFAESLRENLNSKEKEKEYVVSMINDLEQDTALLQSAIASNQLKLDGLDSVLGLASKNFSDPVNKKLLYRYCNSSVGYYARFASNDATMQQLKNAGLQFIRHAHVADSIARYDLAMKSIYAAEALYGKAINDAMDGMGELLIFRLLQDTAYFKHGRFVNDDIPLLTSDPIKLEIFFNKISLEHGWTENYINNLREKLPDTIRLLALLKNEYGID